MNRSSFIGRILARAELWRIVKQTRFVVTPDRDTGAGFLQRVCNCGGKICRSDGRRIGTKKRAPDAEVQNDERLSSEIGKENRGRTGGRLFQITFYSRSLCNRS